MATTNAIEPNDSIDDTIPVLSIPQDIPDSIPYRPGEWYRQHHAVVRFHGHYLGPECLALYSVIASHANTLRQCWVTIPRMMFETNMSRNRVRKALRKLETYTLIHVDWRLFTWKGKSWWGYLITLLDPSPVAVSLRQAGRHTTADETPAPVEYCTEEQVGVHIDAAWGCNLDPKVDLREVEQKEAEPAENDYADSAMKNRQLEPEDSPLPGEVEIETVPSEPVEQTSLQSPAIITDHTPVADTQEQADESAAKEETLTATTTETKTEGTAPTQAQPLPVRTPRQQACPHPATEIHTLSDGIIICHHCFALVMYTPDDGDPRTCGEPRGSSEDPPPLRGHYGQTV
jgi:hypothetical protein